MLRIKIEEVSRVRAGVLSGLRNLLLQLAPSEPNLNAEALQEMVSAKNTFLYIVREAQKTDKIIAGCTLLVYTLLNAKHARIEDMVVDQAFRRQGIGRELMRFVLQKAAQEGACKVELTAHPERKAANRLYRRLGFKPRKPNVFVFELGQKI